MVRRELSRRELLIATGLAPALLSILAACRDDGADGTGTDPTGTDPTGTGAATSGRSSLARLRADASAQLAIGAVNQVGTGLFQDLAAAPLGSTAGSDGANVLLSPAGIAIALAMVREGASGATADEIDRVLGVVDPTTLAPSMNTLDQSLAARTGTRPDPAGTGSIEVKLAIANGLWGQQGVAWTPATLDRLATYYGAGLELTDFAADPAAATAAINDWVADRTEDRIAALLPEGVVDAMTRLVLVNAIYLKAPWLEPFTPAATTDGTFTAVDGSSVTVPFMHSSGQRAYAAGDGWQAVDLPYAGYELTMTVLVPDAGRLADVEAQVAPELLDTIVGTQALRQVSLRLPRWRATTAVPLAEALARLGMANAFDPASADLSGFTTAERLVLSAVQHQADITVDEAGTEAAAATAVVGRATSAPLGDPVELVVDRPFLFMIRDLPTGALLFLGRIGRPDRPRQP